MSASSVPARKCSIAEATCWRGSHPLENRSLRVGRCGCRMASLAPTKVAVGRPHWLQLSGWGPGAHQGGFLPVLQLTSTVPLFPTIGLAHDRWHCRISATPAVSRCSKVSTRSPRWRGRELPNTKYTLLGGIGP